MMKRIFDRIICVIMSILILCGAIVFTSCQKSEDETDDTQESAEPLAEISSLEVYVSGLSRCFIMPGTHREKTWVELLEGDLKTISLAEAKAELEKSGLPDDKIKVYAHISTLSSSIPVIDDNYLKELSALFDDRYVCAKAPQGSGSGVDMPDDFEFSVTWNPCGTSTYDSKTGKLVKDNGASDVSKYTAEHASDDIDFAVYCLLFGCIDFFSYPEEYDPLNAPDSDMYSFITPSSDMVITVTANGKTHTVKCSPFVLNADECWCEQAARFVEVAKAVRDIITSTDEWQNLPEFERLFI